MIGRLAAVALFMVAVSCTTTQIAAAEPDPAVQPVNAISAPPPPDGAVPSAEPAFYSSPEGWNLELHATNETQVAVNPLTTSLASRQYMAGGTFTGKITGNGGTTLAGGTLEVGYQIGCGIMANQVRLTGTGNLTLVGRPRLGLPAGLAVPLTGAIDLVLRPGEVHAVPVTRKAFKGTETRVTVSHIHIKIDGCAGESFLRSYAVLTSESEVADDIVAYYGITKSV